MMRGRPSLRERLAEFSDSELRRELRRRASGDEDELFLTTEVAMCEDCRRFSWGGTKDKPEGVCGAGKKMLFRMPAPGPHDACGYYRVGCTERQQIVQPVDEP